MRCAAVYSNGKCFQLAFEVVVANVRKSQVRWQAVPQTRPVAAKVNSCHRSFCVFLKQCIFWRLMNEAGDGHFQTAGECRLPGTSVRYQIMTGTPGTRVWTSLLEGQEASAIDAGQAWCGSNVLFQWWGTRRLLNWLDLLHEAVRHALQQRVTIV